MKTLLTALVLFLSLNGVFAAPPSADHLIGEAGAKAAREKKAIFVHFSASWCGNCKLLEAFLERKEIKPVFEKYFVPVKLVVDEDQKHKQLENPGAGAWQLKAGGPEGLPFLAFLDSQGKLIVNSQPKVNNETGMNIGFPSAPEEIDWFVVMMKKAAPQIAQEDLKLIEDALRKKP